MHKEFEPDSTKQFLEQISKHYKVDLVTHFQEKENLYLRLLHSLPVNTQINFMTFLNVYLQRSQIDIKIDLTSPLGIACLQKAMEYYFL